MTTSEVRGREHVDGDYEQTETKRKLRNHTNYNQKEGRRREQSSGLGRDQNCVKRKGKKKKEIMTILRKEVTNQPKQKN